jgi:hypothetical protein
MEKEPCFVLVTSNLICKQCKAIPHADGMCAAVVAGRLGKSASKTKA